MAAWVDDVYVSTRRRLRDRRPAGGRRCAKHRCARRRVDTSQPLCRRPRAQTRSARMSSSALAGALRRLGHRQRGALRRVGRRRLSPDAVRVSQPVDTAHRAFLECPVRALNSLDPAGDVDALTSQNRRLLRARPKGVEIASHLAFRRDDQHRQGAWRTGAP
jgi:hypothetical protein